MFRMNSEMDNLYRYLMKPIPDLKPQNVIKLLTKIKKSFVPASHTAINADFIIDQIENTWEEGCLTPQTLIFFSTNVIYDNQKVISLRQHVARFTARNRVTFFEPRVFDVPN